jgi:hypothetical protein
VVRHAKEAESQGSSSRPTLASAAMPRWGMANVGKTHFPTKCLIEGEIAILGSRRPFQGFDLKCTGEGRKQITFF